MREKINELFKTKYKYFLLLGIGILLFIFSFTGNNSKLNDATDLEQKLKNTLEMAEGVGDINVMLSYGEENRVEGAIIIAEGADNISVKKMLHDSALAVLDVPEYKVQILIKKR